MLDVYGTTLMSTRALKKELKRLNRLSKAHHARNHECNKIGCNNPYSIIVESFQTELASRGKTKPIEFRPYLAKLLGKITKLWNA